MGSRSGVEDLPEELVVGSQRVESAGKQEPGEDERNRAEQAENGHSGKVLDRGEDRARGGDAQESSRDCHREQEAPAAFGRVCLEQLCPVSDCSQRRLR